MNFIVFGIVLFLIVFGLFLISPPKNFSEVLVDIEEGMSVKDISRVLEQNNVVKLSSVFTFLTIAFHKDSSIKSGQYSFKEPIGVLETLNRLTTGDYGIETIKITIHEGSTVNDMAEIFSAVLPQFNKDNFIAIALPVEGYLFPDTYKFLETSDEEIVFNVLRETFNEKTQELQNDLFEKEISFEDVVKMASIIEREASATSKQDVSNILWKRIEIGMALQVDAPFVYERQKGSFDLSISDLREDSLYNTYTRTGLTPTPISNPGLEALIAAAYPVDTEYLFFLTGRDGQMYYAKTHDGHVQNKNFYLR